MIVLKLKPEIRLSDWISREEWDEVFKDNLPALMGLLNEDWLAVIEEAGGLEGLIVSAEWVDAPEGEAE